MNNENPNNTQVPDSAPETVTPLVPDQTAPTQAVLTKPPKKRRSLKLMIAGGIAALLVILGAGSALGYTMWYQNPDKVVHDAVIGLMKVKTASSTGTIVYKAEGVTMDISLEGKSAESTSEIALSAKISIDNGQMNQAFEAKGVGRIIGDTIYFKVTGIKDIVDDVMAQSGGAISLSATEIYDKFEDKWISVKPSDYQQFDESIAKQQTCLTNLMKKVQSDNTLRNEVADLYRKNQIISVKEELGEKKVGDTASLGYKVAIDTDKAASFATGLENTTLGKEIKNCDENIDFKELAEDITGETNTNTTPPTIELWASKFGHTLTEVNITANDTNGGNLAIAMQPSFDGDITIETPSDATSLTAVLEDIQRALTESFSQMYGEQMTLPTDLEAGLNLESAV